MANQIAQFFAPYPEQDAIVGIRDHLAKFWDPAMRRDLRAIAVEQQPHEGTEPAHDDATRLGALVLQAVLAESPANGS